jgi:hypothetical protein
MGLQRNQIAETEAFGDVQVVEHHPEDVQGAPSA